MMFKFALGAVAASRVAGVFLAREDAHVIMTCDYNASQVFDLPAHQEPSAFFTKEDWQALSVPGELYPFDGGDVTVEPGGKYVFDQRVRIAAFTRIWSTIPKFFSGYFPDAKWWLQGYSLLGSIRTATTSPWVTTGELTVSDSFNTYQTSEKLLEISRNNSEGEVDRVTGADCQEGSSGTCNVIRFPEDVDETRSVVLVVKDPSSNEKMIGRFVDLLSGTFVEVNTLGLDADTPLNRECTIDGSAVHTPLDPVKYLRESRYPDINYEAEDGKVYWKTKREGMQCSLWECPKVWPFKWLDGTNWTGDAPDPFQPTFAISKDMGLLEGGWTPVPRSATNVSSCEDVTNQMARFTGSEGVETNEHQLGRIQVKAKCRES